MSEQVPPPPGDPAPGADAGLEEAKSKKILVGVLAIVLGSLGIHKFVLGYTVPGVIMLCVTVLTCGTLSVVPWVIGIIEGITYLTKTDAEFKAMYLDNKKEWF